MRPVGLALVVSSVAMAAAPAFANDTEAAFAIGGLVLKKNDAIVMESEDLRISQEEIRVRYVYRNKTPAPVTITIAFPLPALNFATAEDQPTISDVDETLKFRTTVDGAAIAYVRDERATFEGRNVTERLRALGLPLDSQGARFVEAVEKLPPAERQALVAEKLVDDSSRGANDRILYAPRWTYALSLLREQTFPPGAPVKVEHVYAPVAGGSVAGSLEPQYRKENIARYRKTWCTDAAFIAAFDREVKKRKTSAHGEKWLAYVLKTGANWAGPIRDFRMVIDKGKPENLVSFCADGVKKIAPTEFEVKKKNFTPTRDVEVLIVEWAGKEGQ